MSELSVFRQTEGCRLSPHCENTRRKCRSYLYKGRKSPAVILLRYSGWMLDHIMQLPVVGANGVQNILDTVLPLHALLGFINHGWQVLQMGFKRKKNTHLSSPFRLAFRNAKSIRKGCLLEVHSFQNEHWRTEVDSFLIFTAAWKQSINVFFFSKLLSLRTH